MDKFISKKDRVFAAIHWSIIIALVFLSSLSIYLKYWFAIPLLLAPFAFFLWTWFQTQYELRQDLLLIRSGPLCWKIPVSSIRKVNRTNNGTSSPALSLNRLEIIHEDGSIFISPEHEQEFISKLKTMNVRIQVEGKQNKGRKK
ncbi:PH domain-containing protein [Paenibacillus sp. S-38]|uniref:PH domain-containing protein n=1 Tax=Paenibacillus sp. S-38 TaxID=3416710 RepID=UPI003CEF2BE1